MRSLIERLINPRLNRDQQIVASGLGTFLGILIGLALLLVSPAVINALFG